MYIVCACARVCGTDLDILETLSLQRIRENKQLLKMAAKCDKDLDLLRRKHEKVNEITVIMLDLALAFCC